MQSHLLFRSFLLRSRSGSARREAARIEPAGVHRPGRADRASACATAMRIDGDDAEAIAKVLQVHPVFFPRTYVDIAVDVETADRVRFAIRDSPVFAEADEYHWFTQLGGAGDRALDAIVQAVNPRASVTATTPRRASGSPTTR